LRQGLAAVDGFAARRVLILAPHPDDEIVACGIAAARAVAAGSRVFVLHLTTGVPEREAFWPWQRAGHPARLRRRRAEAEAAAALLRLESTGFLPWPSRRLREHLDEAVTAIARALADCGAEALWVPAFEGAHQDHDAANALAAIFRGRLPVWEFATYNFAGGRINSNRFPAENGSEIVFDPSPAEVTRKQQALACYASERGNLAYIRVEREVCRPLPPHDYGAPPHPGKLFRERFHWVPFQHPRIDFAPSAEVYGEIARWASLANDGGAPALSEPPSGKPGQADRELAGALDQTQSERGLSR
jgi:LmbE family N-acetylglucosaminyl deacetylase